MEVLATFFKNSLSFLKLRIYGGFLPFYVGFAPESGGFCPVFRQFLVCSCRARNVLAFSGLRNSRRRVRGRFWPPLACAGFLFDVNLAPNSHLSSLFFNNIYMYMYLLKIDMRL